MVRVENLHKKFSRDLKSSMYYGMIDVVQGLFGFSRNKLHLKPHEFWAIKELNLEVRAGEILAVVGANGSGKTTLMRLIAGIYPSDHGKISYNNIDKITPVFALSAGMQPLFTGRENISIKGSNILCIDSACTNFCFHSNMMFLCMD